MQRIFEAILKGNLLEWANEVPKQGDEPILEKIAASNVFADIIDPVEWQRELRQDRPLPGRDE
ncbi:MAG: hypothetical protein JGK08_20250 [Microcoleus sp. PH2017_04_SCI_O_A]|nr:hypothetical protein [Microcoleus sp. PH2017_04_SCI_O_A]